MDRAAAALGLGVMAFLGLSWQQFMSLVEVGLNLMAQLTILAFVFVVGMLLYIKNRGR